MFRYLPIRSVTGREILDSRGNPTVEVEVAVGEGILGLEGHMGRAQVPSGASTGKFEALEKRDQEVRYLGQGVRKAVEAVNTVLADAVVGENALEQERIDHILCQADGTETKENLGANAILGVSLAVARAAANALHLPLYQYLGGCHTSRMPVPMMNILNGGRHADNTVDLQEFMIMPCGAPSFREGLSMCAEIYHTLKQLLKEKGYSTSVGDEGGFAPDLKDSDEALQLIVNAVQKAGYAPGNDVMIAIDAAASELYEESRNVYYFPGESRQCGKTVFRDTAEMVAYYEELIEKYPIVSIEDGLCEDDFEGWKQMTEALGNLCFSGKYSQRDVLKMLAGKGGLVAHLNQNSVQQICIDIEKGDQKSKAVLDAMSYSIAKEIGAMAAVLKGQVDAILLTGGVAYNEPVNDVIREHCSFLAPIFIYPGEDEMGALMLNALSKSAKRS